MKKLLLFSLVALLLNACSSDDNPDPVNNTITVTPSKVEDISQNGGTFTIELKTSGEWTMSTQNADWCTLSAKAGKGNASVEIKVTKNTTTVARSTKITVSNGSVVASVEVSQKAKEERLIEGRWISDKMEIEVEADSQETIDKITESLRSYSTTSMRLEWEGDNEEYEKYGEGEKYQISEWRLGGGSSSNPVVFAGDTLRNTYGRKLYTLIDGKFYTEYDALDSYKSFYPDLKKAVRKEWLTKKTTPDPDDKHFPYDKEFIGSLVYPEGESETVFIKFMKDRTCSFFVSHVSNASKENPKLQEVITKYEIELLDTKKFRVVLDNNAQIKMGDGKIIVETKDVVNLSSIFPSTYTLEVVIFQSGRVWYLTNNNDTGGYKFEKVMKGYYESR